MGRYLEMLRSNADTEAPVCSSPDCEKSEISSHQADAPPILREIAALPPVPCPVRGCPEHSDPSALPEGSRRAPIPLRRCGVLLCRTCHVHSPSPHKADCPLPRYDVCRSRWFWRSPHGAIKCIACAAPASLELVEGWVLARETGEGADGWRIPGEILSLLHVAGPPQ
jgi:hypothetical protein